MYPSTCRRIQVLSSVRFRSAIANGRYRKGPLSQKSAGHTQNRKTKTNTNPSPDPNRYRRRCPDPNARIQKFIHYMAIATFAIADCHPVFYSRIQVDTCSLDYNFYRRYRIHIVDGDKGYKWIQVDTTCIRATCIRCKRGITGSALVSINV